jgi:hypothetical protein
MKRYHVVFFLAVGVLGWLGASPAQAGLVGYWQFDDSANLGKNTVLPTESLTVAGDAQYTSAGKFGGGLLLDGNGDYLYFDPLTSAPTGIPIGNSSYTIAAWIKPIAVGGLNREGIVGWGNFGTSRQVNAFRTGDGASHLTNYWWAADLANVSTSPVNLYDGNWHHVVATYNGKVRSIWVDGVLKAQDTPGTNNAQGINFRLGAIIHSYGNEYFNGTLDEVAIWNNGLTANQIQALAAGGSASSLPLPQPVDHFVADSLASLGNGRVLANGDWKSLGSNTNAQANVAGGDATLRTNAIGNHAVVNFDGDDYLRIINGAMTTTAGGDFTIVAVYRTNEGVGGDIQGTNQWWQNTSIVDSEQAGLTNDWGLGISSNGKLAAGLGGSSSDSTLYSSSGGYYKDGRAHVAVYTRTGGTMNLYVDGALVGTLTGASTALRNAVDYFFGGNHTGGNKLIGDLAEVRVYDVTLDSTQVAALSSQLLATYAGSPYQQAVLNTSGLAAYYRLGEGTTTAAKAYNEVGPGNTHGTFYNSPTVNQPGPFTIHDFNTAVRFDGTDDYIRVPNFLVATGAADFSLEVLINTTAESLTGNQAYEGNGIIWSDKAGVADDFILAVLNNRIAFFDGDANGGAGATIIGTTPINDGRWHHVVATREAGGLMKLYVDGMLEASGLAGSAVLDDNPNIDIGGNTGDSRYFNGLIDEVAFYTRVLTPQEILQHYQVANIPEPSSLVLALLGFGGLALLARCRKIKGYHVSRMKPLASPLAVQRPAESGTKPGE